MKWKGGSGDWVTLKDLKESYPPTASQLCYGLKESYLVPLANYALVKGLQTELAFAWWIPYRTG